MSILEDVKIEAQRAKAHYGLFASTHEAYGVLAEEVAELLDAIRANDIPQIEKEAIQVAAVASRLAHQCRSNPDPKDVFHSRSTGK